MLVVNILGSFIRSFLFALPAMKDKGSGPSLFADTGVLSGYTTLPTLANDSWLLLNQHSWLALLNAIGSMLPGITAAAVGRQTGVNQLTLLRE